MIPDRELQNCYDEFCHQVSFFYFSFHHLAHPIRSSGHSSTTQSSTPPKPNSFTNSPLTNNMSLPTNVSPTTCEGAIICVNGYQLMLLPNLLRSSPRLTRTAPIEFFIQVVFFSSEIFRCLSARQDLLLGLLGRIWRRS